MPDISGKKAIVLGGTSGIGEATCRALLDIGVSVVCASRRGTSDLEHPNLTPESVDVLDRQGLKRLFEKHAPYDFLVNAATGGSRAMGPFLEMDLDGFQGSFAKLWGYTNSVSLGAQHLAADGAIVLVSGYPARRCKPGYVAIASVGGAVEQFVRGVAPELAPIRINVVSPGVIDTPLFPAEGEARRDFLENATGAHIIPRAGKPEEVAAGILFGLENQFVTGTTIDVDGGALLS